MTEAEMREIARAVVREAKEEFSDIVAAKINEHRLVCEAKGQIADIRDTLARARGGWIVLAVLASLVAGVVGVISTLKAMMVTGH